VLLSIYEGDENFKQVSSTVYHYKYAESDADAKGFLVEIEWGADYPNQAPLINMDQFFNKHILPEVRAEIKAKLLEQAEENIGMPMTYTLFEWAKENASSLTASQPEKATGVAIERREPSAEAPDTSGLSPIKKKEEKLTKSQKRKMAGRVVNGELPRGHDWVDVIKHLCQGGPHIPSAS